MKQIDKMSRLTGELEKCFRMMNRDFFDDSLPTPVITVVPTAKAYAHYVPFDIWDTKDAPKREINIASGTLDRPLESVLASLLHEMVHMYNDCVLHVQDTSRQGTYHNRRFAQEAEAKGLIVTRSDKYGWAHTEPGDRLLDWILAHDELREIDMNRSSSFPGAVGVGTHTGSRGVSIPGTKTGHSRKYTCPCCHNSVRATKAVNILCGDCMEPMLEG